MARKMGPLNAEHPLFLDGTQCPACQKGFKMGDYVTLIVLGPGDDPEEQANAKAGRAYNAVAAPVHWDCAGEVEKTRTGEPV